MHLTLPSGLTLQKGISDKEYETMIHIMEQNDLSRYIIEKEQFYAIIHKQDGVVAFGRIFSIGPNQLELGSLRVDERYRGHKLGLAVSDELIKNKRGDNDLYLATRRKLGSYYEKLGFEIITKNIPEKLVHTGIWAQSQGIDFIIMKLK